MRPARPWSSARRSRTTAYRARGLRQDARAQRPWAMFSTGGGGALAVCRRALCPRRAEATPAPAMTDAIPGVDPTMPHTYRIEWSATDVKYFVDGVLEGDAHAHDDRVHRPDASGRQRPHRPAARASRRLARHEPVPRLGRVRVARAQRGQTLAPCGARSPRAGSAAGIDLRDAHRQHRDARRRQLVGLPGRSAPAGRSRARAGSTSSTSATLSTADDRVTPSLDSVSHRLRHRQRGAERRDRLRRT